MVRILTKQLVDGKEVTFQIAHQPRNIIDCDVESEEEGGLLGGAELKGLFSELKGDLMAAVKDEDEGEKAEEDAEKDSLYDDDSEDDDGLDDVN